MHLLTLLAQDQVTQTQIQQMAVAMMAIMPIFILIILAIVILPFWFICKKAGFSPWLSLLNIVPLGGLVLMYVLAFAQWKVVPAPQPSWQPQPPYPPQG
jgi:hypothetical protein